jgi:hypothetical protein
VTPEINYETKLFADPGDSGAGVICRDVTLIGFVMARTTLTNCRIVVDPKTEHLDLGMTARFRNVDGSIDFNKVWYRVQSKVRVVLIICVDILERMRIKGMEELHIKT